MPISRVSIHESSSAALRGDWKLVPRDRFSTLGVYCAQASRPPPRLSHNGSIGTIRSTYQVRQQNTIKVNNGSQTVPLDEIATGIAGCIVVLGATSEFIRTTFQGRTPSAGSSTFIFRLSIMYLVSPRSPYRPLVASTRGAPFRLEVQRAGAAKDVSDVELLRLCGKSLGEVYRFTGSGLRDCPTSLVCIQVCSSRRSSRNLLTLTVRKRLESSNRYPSVLGFSPHFRFTNHDCFPSWNNPLASYN